MSKSVSVIFTYECGRCARTVRRTYTTGPDGLLEIPQVYCGGCLGHKRLSTMSVTISGEKTFETPDPITKVQGLPRRNDVSDTLCHGTPLGQPESGRVAADAPTGEDGPAGEPGAPRVSSLPPKKRVSG